MTRRSTQQLIDEAVALAAASAAETDRLADRLDPACAGLVERFGALGAFGLPLDDYARLLGAVAGECLSSAFSIWAHRMVIEYLRAAGGFDEMLAELLAGRRSGSIAMATAMQELAGVGAVPTRAVREGEGYRVHGRIAWASNIVEGTVVVFPARVVEQLEDDGSAGDAVSGSGGQRVILAAVVGSDGLQTREVSDLLALGATRSAMLNFTGLRVEGAGVVADSLDACLVRRSTHLLLQSAFCLGIARRSLAEAEAQLEGPGGVLAAHHERLSARRSRLDDTLAKAIGSVAAGEAAGEAAASDVGAERVLGAEAATPQLVTLLRYEAARLAHAAALHESMLMGGRGFVTTSATNRRLREASFLPVQSPSEVQLVQELEGFGVYVTENYSI